MRYRLVVRLTAADVGQRVVIRWLLPGSDQMTDVLGILEAFDGESFTVRKRDGQLVVIPRARAVAGKVVPPPPPRRERKSDDDNAARQPPGAAQRARGLRDAP